jgi:hypothetical protein
MLLLLLLLLLLRIIMFLPAVLVLDVNCWIRFTTKKAVNLMDSTTQKSIAFASFVALFSSV